ncbi:MAG: hypothetical protein JNK33_03275 [Candidatus Doudnabacteria bacterium]|nr:hypothetical protein [Candidatus Doudnabacteria bacterium]
MELTKEYFDKHYQELNEFLSEQFEKVFARFEMIDNQFKVVATKAEFTVLQQRLETLDGKVSSGFAEQSIKLDFIQTDIATLRKDLEALAKRTKEDDNSFTKEILKLKNRLDTLERQVQVLKKQKA